MQKDGDAVPQVDICHMKSPAHDSQHGVGTLGLHARYTLLHIRENLKDAQLKPNIMVPVQGCGALSL